MPLLGRSIFFLTSVDNAYFNKWLLANGQGPHAQQAGFSIDVTCLAILSTRGLPLLYSLKWWQFAHCETNNLQIMSYIASRTRQKSKTTWSSLKLFTFKYARFEAKTDSPALITIIFLAKGKIGRDCFPCLKVKPFRYHSSKKWILERWLAGNNGNVMTRFIVWQWLKLVTDSHLGHHVKNLSIQAAYIEPSAASASLALIWKWLPSNDSDSFHFAFKWKLSND